MRDEARHSALAWRTVASLLYELSVRQNLQEYVDLMMSKAVKMDEDKNHKETIWNSWKITRYLMNVFALCPLLRGIISTEEQQTKKKSEFQSPESSTDFSKCQSRTQDP
jgi:hypothetical protein